MTYKRYLSRLTEMLVVALCLIGMVTQVHGSGGTKRIECLGAIGEGLEAFAIQGHYVYAAGGFMLHVIDVVDPEKPREVGWVRLGYRIKTVDVLGPAVYLGTEEDGGVQIVDVSDPSKPQLHKSRVQLGGNTHTKTQRMGKYLIFRSSGSLLGTREFAVCNLNDPFHPEPVLEGELSGKIYNTFLTNGDQIFCTDMEKSGQDGLVLAVEDRTTTPPQRIGSYRCPEDQDIGFHYNRRTGQLSFGVNSTSSSLNVTHWGNVDHLWAGTDYELKTTGAWVLEQGKPTTLSPKAGGDPVMTDLPSDLSKILVHNDALYLQDGETIRMFDLSDHKSSRERAPAEPVKADEDQSLQSYGDCVILLRSGSLWFYDVSQPFAWRLLSHWGQAIPADMVKVAGHMAYLIGGKQLSIVDCTKPAKLRLLATHDLPTEVKACAIENERLFASNEDGDLLTFNVAQPTSPTLSGSTRLSSVPQAMAASGNRLFAASGEAGLAIYDISDPVRIKPVSTFKTEEACLDLVTSGTMVYLLTARSLDIVDTNDASKPVLLGMLPITWSIHNGESDPIHQMLKRLGNIVYLIRCREPGVEYISELKIADVSNPAAPQWVGKGLTVSCEGDRLPNPVANARPETDTSGWLLGLPTSFHISNQNGRYLVLYDLSTPQQPVPVAVYEAFHDPYTSAVLYKGQVYKADGESGLLILGRTETPREAKKAE